MSSLFRKLISFPKRVVTIVIGVVALIVVVTMYFRGLENLPPPILAKDEIIILRTPGGMLEVTTLIRNEEFKWSTAHTCFPLDCGLLLGKTLSEVKVPVHYTYHIPLASVWQLEFKSNHFDLTVPKPEPKLPAAIDVKKLEIKTDGNWFSPDKADHRESVIRNIGPEFDRRATQKNYLDAQKEEAKKTVTEFAQKWMLEQGVAANKRGYPIRVYFSGETHLP